VGGGGKYVEMSSKDRVQAKGELVKLFKVRKVARTHKSNRVEERKWERKKDKVLGKHCPNKKKPGQKRKKKDFQGIKHMATKGARGWGKDGGSREKGGGKKRSIIHWVVKGGGGGIIANKKGRKKKKAMGLRWQRSGGKRKTGPVGSGRGLDKKN